MIQIGSYARAFTNKRNSDGTGLTISGYTGATLYPWIIEGGIGDYEVTVNDLDGGADVSQFAFTVLDRNGAITGDFPTNTLEGQTVTVYMGFVGLCLHRLYSSLSGLCRYHKLDEQQPRIRVQLP